MKSQQRSGDFGFSAASTCLLLKPDGVTIENFGYQAEKKYAELSADNEHQKWYFFRRFKMSLHGQKVSQVIIVSIRLPLHKILIKKECFSQKS